MFRSRELIGKLVDRLALTEDPEFNGLLRPEPEFSVGKVRAWVKELILGPEPEGPPPTEQAIRDAVINGALAALSISNVRQSYVFKITAVTESPRKSALIANTLAELYILDQLEVKFEATEQATEWLTERVGQLQVELEQSVAEVEAFNTGTTLVSPETLAALNRQLKDLRDRVVGADEAVTLAETRLAELQAAKASETPDVMEEVAGDRTLTRVHKLLEDGGASARDTFDARFAQVVARAELERDRAVSQRDALAGSVDNMQSRITEQSADLVQLQQLQREAEASRLIYEYFLGRLKETSVQQGIQQADSRILSRAVVPNVPSAPRKSRILLLSAILCMMLGGGLVLLREMMQNTFRTAEDLAAITGYTVMGQIPKIPARKRAGVLKYLMDKPNSAASEAIRNLRTSIMLSNVDNPPQIIMSTSAIPGEGKTTQSIALAHNFSGLGKKVLLIEGDIRRLVFTNYFDLPGERGLLSVLSGDIALEEAIVHEPGLGVDVLKGERSSTNAADVFSSHRFTDLLEQARKTYDTIIIDTPPVLVVPDARVIGQAADATLMAIRWNATSKSQVQEALRLFEIVNFRITGLVLNQIDAKGMKKYGYGASYGAYGTYGKSYYND